MKTNIYIIFITIFFIISCNKTEVSGTVYSKHGYVVPNASIRLLSHRNEDSPKAPSTSSYITTTNSDGTYYFKFRKKHQYFYHVSCSSDSGSSFVEIKSKKLNSIDLYVK